MLIGDMIDDERSLYGDGRAPARALQLRCRAHHASARPPAEARVYAIPRTPDASNISCDTDAHWLSAGSLRQHFTKARGCDA